MSPFREEDLSAKVAHNTEYLKKLEARVSDIENNKTKASWLDFLRDFYVPQAIGVLILLGVLIGLTLHAENCTRQQNADAAALADAQAAAAEATAPETTGERNCERLCESMGLRGGVVMDYNGTWHGTGTHAGDFDITRQGHSCMCGNGMGGSVRVDPDGHWSAQSDHPGPAAAPDAGTP